MSDRLQLIGLCRFSYPANLNGFQTSHGGMAERRAGLYDPASLAIRFYLFELF